MKLILVQEAALQTAAVREEAGQWLGILTRWLNNKKKALRQGFSFIHRQTLP